MFITDKAKRNHSALHSHIEKPYRSGIVHISAVFLILMLCSLKSISQESLNDIISIPTMEKYIQIAKENYPRTKSLTRSVDLAKNNLNIERWNWIDMISLTFIYAPNYSFNIIDPTYFDGIQIGASLNLATFFQKPLNIKSRKIEIEQAKLSKEEYDLTLEREVRNRYVAYIQSIGSLKLQSKSLNDALSVMNQTEIRYNRSEVTFEIFLQAQTSLNGAKQAKLSAEAANWSAKWQLEELLTKRIEDIK